MLKCYSELRKAVESQMCSAVGIYSVHSVTTWIQPSISTRRPKSVPKALTTN